jgi:hypothetical protein
MKKLLLTSFIAFAALNVSAEAPKTKWSVYRSNKLMVQVQVPSAWEARKTDKALAFTSPTIGEQRAAFGVLKSAEQNLTIEQAAEKEFEMMGKPADWTRGYARLAGRRAMKIVGATPDKPDTMRIEYYVEAPNGIYLVQCIAPRDAWTLYSPLFQRILEKFKFLDE